MTSDEIKRALFAYFRPPEWACFAEMRDGTGMACMRSFDLWTINCYPSTGHRTVGIEIKISRNDFLRELNKPAKRDSIETLAMETYFACPLGVLKPEELPEKWGLFTVSDKGARLAKRAVQREQVKPDINFLASVCRRAAEIEGKARADESKQLELKAWMAETSAFLDSKWKAHLSENEKRYVELAKAEVIKELLGEGLNELRHLMNQEIGWSYRDDDIAQRLVSFYNHVKAGKHVENQVAKVKKTLETALQELNKREVSA